MGKTNGRGKGGGCDGPNGWDYVDGCCGVLGVVLMGLVVMEGESSLEDSSKGLDELRQLQYYQGRISINPLMALS